MTYQRYPVRGPWKGIMSDMGAPLDDPAAFDDALNFLMTKGRLSSRPRLNLFGYHDEPALGLVTFQDVVNNYHTLYLTINDAHFITPGPVFNTLVYNGSFPGLAGYRTGRFYSLAEIVSKVYFCNGSCLVSSVDGSNAVSDAGDVPGSCLFLEVDGTGTHLIGANWFEPAPGQAGATSYPRRIRWADSGNPDVWTPAFGNTAGLDELEECPDVVTGLATLGRNTYIYRTDGITVMYPTGVGAAPFGFEDLSKADAGIGSIFPYALAKFDSNCIAISFNDIYLNANGSLTPIAAGKVKKRIYNDLQDASGQVSGWILPNLGPGMDFLAYYLNIPGPNVTWVYSFDDMHWVRINSSLGAFGCIANVLVA